MGVPEIAPEIARDLMGFPEIASLAARAKNPKRWSGKTRNWSRIDRVHLNPEKSETGSTSG